jgi:hypothetical protein
MSLSWICRELARLGFLSALPLDCAISPGNQEPGTPKFNIINNTHLAKDVPNRRRLKE